LKAQDFDAAWKAFEEFNTGGGDIMPTATWLELIRNLESQQNFERAVTEYEHLAAAYPAQKESLLALLSAGRLYLKKLNRPAGFAELQSRTSLDSSTSGLGSEYQDGDSGRRGSLQAPRHRHSQTGPHLTRKRV
jgi:hypothetical protein